MNRLRSLREDAGMNQKDLAKRLGVADSVMSRYEGGTISLSEDALRQISIIFGGVSVDYILGLSDDKGLGGTKAARSSYVLPQVASDLLALTDKFETLSEAERADLLRCAKNTEALAVAGRFIRLSQKSKRRVVEYMDLLRLADEQAKAVRQEPQPSEE